MTETSRYWDGLATGDATLAPYLASTYQSIWDILFATADNQGYLESFLNELVVTGVSGAVEIATGGAVVDGVFYESNEVETIAIPTPTTNSRIDRIVARKNPTTQEVRLFRIEGTEGAPPVAPSLVQIVDATWDIPLARAGITTAGDITLADDREKARTPLVGIGNSEKIETITADGIITSFDFQDIPQRFKHLLLIGFGKHSDPGPDDAIELYAQFNGDTTSGNYRGQFLFGNDAVAGAAVQNPTVFSGAFVGSFLSEGVNPNVAGQFRTRVPNYSLTTLYKTIINKVVEMPFVGTPNSTRFIADVDSLLWQDTSAIERINIVADPVTFPIGIPFTAGSQITLYGYD